ncbi:MAG: hypothetical protein AB1449_12245 [Chloroflexota bacterium]
MPVNAKPWRLVNGLSVNPSWGLSFVEKASLQGPERLRVVIVVDDGQP